MSSRTVAASGRIQPVVMASRNGMQRLMVSPVSDSTPRPRRPPAAGGTSRAGSSWPAPGARSRLRPPWRRGSGSGGAPAEQHPRHLPHSLPEPMSHRAGREARRPRCTSRRARGKRGPSEPARQRRPMAAAKPGPLFMHRSCDLLRAGPGAVGAASRRNAGAAAAVETGIGWLKEIGDAGEVQGAAEGGRGGPVREARGDQGERAQGCVAGDAGLDEREGAGGFRLHQAQGEARARRRQEVGARKRAEAPRSSSAAPCSRRRCPSGGRRGRRPRRGSRGRPAPCRGAPPCRGAGRGCS